MTASTLAQTGQSTTTLEPSEHHTFLAFRVAGQRFAFPLFDVREIRPWQTITRVPRAPDAVLGVVAVRGAIVTVCDMRAVLGMPHVAVGPRARVILAKTEHEQVGFLVDEVLQVVRISPESIESELAVDFPIPILGVGRVRGATRNERTAADEKQGMVLALLRPDVVMASIQKGAS